MTVKKNIKWLTIKSKSYKDNSICLKGSKHNDGQSLRTKYIFYTTVRICVATTIEKVFLDSDDGLCIKKIRQIQWDKGFLI